MARWKGLRKALGMFDELSARSQVRLRQTLREEGEEIMTDIKASRPGKGVPVDEGILRNSGRVTGPKGTGRPRVELSFGGPAAPYALRQHEDLTLSHNVGEARYLVKGWERRSQGGTVEKALAENLESAIKATRRL